MHKVGVVVVALVFAAATATYAGWIPTVGSGEEEPSPPPPELAEPPAVVPGLELAEPPPPAAVLGPTTGDVMRPALLRAAVQASLGDRSLGRSVGFVAQDLRAPSAAWRSGSQTVIPASTLKLLTAATVLAELGPDHRFRTTVVTGAGPRQLVLVGGGDPLLTDRLPEEETHPRPATLAALARATAARLERDGVRRVSLTYDASLFSGPSVNPTWEPDYVPDNVVSPITALWVDEGREIAGFALRVPDPALVAAERFANLLAAQGVTVRQPPTAGRAGAAANEIAAVESPPLAAIVQHTLEASDNEAAEVLLRQAAIAAGRPGSSAAGVQTVRTTLTGLGVDLSGARLYDGSGLSRDNVLPMQALVDVLTIAADEAHPELGSVITTLPVAGFNGSLAYRFVDVAPGGLGRVRAKTGTLTGVHGLAGLAVTADGRPVVFAVVADRVPVPRTLDARAQLDTIAAQLATCSCS